MDKYIIDGVEYYQGEEVEVRDFIDSDWEKDFLYGIDSSVCKFVCESGNWKYVRKLQTIIKTETSNQIHITIPNDRNYIYTISLLPSGRKTKLTLDDGTVYSVVVE